MNISIALKNIYCPRCKLAPVQSPFLGFDTNDEVEPARIFEKKYRCEACRITFRVTASIITSVDELPGVFAAPVPEVVNHAFGCNNCGHTQAQGLVCTKCGSISLTLTSI